MAVGGIHHDHVNTGFHQCGHALVGTGTGADGGAYSQTTLRVLAGVGIFGGFLDVFHGDHAAQFAFIVDYHDFFDAMLVQQGLNFIRASAFLHGHQPVLAGHDVLHALVVVGDEAGITAGDNADNLIAFHHRHTGNVIGFGNAQQLGHGGFRAHGDGIFHHAGFVFLYHAHVTRLVGCIHAFMEDTDAPFLRHGDGQAVLGNRIHGCGRQRNIQSNVPSQFRFQGHVLGQHIGMGGNKQNVVKR